MSPKKAMKRKSSPVPNQLANKSQKVDEEENEQENSDEGVEQEEVKGDSTEDTSDKDNDDSASDDKDVTKKHANKKKIAAKTRYVVFVGNLSFKSTADEIRNHFKETGDIVDVRLATHKDGKSKGFGFVELKDSTSYEKAISLNHTFMEGRRINVEYTDKSSDKKQIQKKNLKLQAMRKSGKLEGSVKSNQKRSVRRAKARQAKQQET